MMQIQNRYNRIYEYDSLTPRFSDFLLNELIPEVGKQYNLSKNPDDRALSGVSTGAVGAFMAAWNRPDQFHRVLSLIGTYVAMKGADALPALVRRTEPKPIRIFMQDGTADHITAAEPYGTNFSGSWPINNQVMYEALEFAGYDVKLEMGTEGHNLKQGGAILPNALRWLWRDYPAPIVVHEPAASHEPGYDASDRVFSTIFADKPWEEVGGDYGSISSLTSDRKGNVYFVDPQAAKVDRVDRTGNVTQFVGLPKGTSILRIGTDDRVYTYSFSKRGIISSNTAAGVASDRKVISSDVGEVADFAVTQNGTVYFLNAGAATIGVINPSGQPRLALGWAGRADEMLEPRVLALSPDQSMLVITDGGSRYCWSFQIAADGTLENGEPFFRLELPETTEASRHTGSAGAAEDTNGNVYFATPLGIQVAMQNGRIMQILNPPDPSTPGAPLTAMTFAGANGNNWLYVAENGKLYRRAVKVAGANAWTVVKPPKPTL